MTEALAYLNAQVAAGAMFAPGWCKRKSADAYRIPTDGTPDASSAWHATRHRFTGQWVRGAFIWWTGGSAGHGHVAICAWRKGHIRTVDFPRVGHWNRTTVTELEAAWPNLDYAGTSLDINGVPVRQLPRRRRLWAHP